VRIQIVKWVSIAALVLAIAFWSSATNYQSALSLFVSMAAGVVAFQAYQARRNRWFMGFVTIAAVFGVLAVAALIDPTDPTLRLDGMTGILLVLAAIAAFATSLAKLKPTPLLSIASITDRNPGSRAL
jgi:hypothetical protein